MTETECFSSASGIIGGNPSPSQITTRERKPGRHLPAHYCPGHQSAQLPGQLRSDAFQGAVSGDPASAPCRGSPRRASKHPAWKGSRGLETHCPAALKGPHKANQGSRLSAQAAPERAAPGGQHLFMPEPQIYIYQQAAPLKGLQGA